MAAKHFVAFDLGATSGRTILGTLDGENLSLKELTRFPNTMVAHAGHHYWNIFSLYDHLKAGLAAAAGQGAPISSVGIDTWGVDFAFVGSDGSVLGLPFAYRDAHTATAHEECFAELIPRREVYNRTGIQVMNFNSVYQLYAMRRDRCSQLAAASRLLFMPDALAYMLTGQMVTEYTIASTSQLMDPRTGRMDGHLLGLLGLREDIFPPIVRPGHRIGTITPDIARETGIGQIPVIAVAGHDTASAVAAVPAADENFAYLSSGTWSLMGLELKEPVIDDRTYSMNFTNEGGVDGTTRLLKNITGMWIVEQCLRRWKADGADYSYPQLVALAESAPAFRAFIDPDDPSFASPPDMPAAIDAYLDASGQSRPGSHGEYIRLIFESLALKYRKVLDLLRSLAPFPVEKLHVIGGGSRNGLLNRFTANSVGMPVVAGPAEATAIGNIMLQARSAGMVGSLGQMRRVIAGAVETETFLPVDSAVWDEAYHRFCTITENTYNN